MDTIEFFLYLLYCHLNNISPNGEKGINWHIIYKFAQRNNVSGMIMEEVKKLPGEYRPKGELYSSLNQKLTYDIESFDTKMRTLAVLISAFTANKIPHLLVKGVVNRNYYPTPELRTSGDTDIIVNRSDFFKAMDVLRSRGFEVELTNENVAVFRNDDEMYELRSELESINIQSKIYFSTPFDDISESQGYTYKLKPYYNLLYIMTHITHHLIEGNANIRMITDVDVVIRKYEEIEISKFLFLCDNIKIKKTAEAVIALSKKWFKTPVVVDFTFEDKDNEEFLHKLRKAFIKGEKLSDLSADFDDDEEEKSFLKKLFSKTKSIKSKEISQMEKEVFEELNIKEKEQ